MTKHVIYFVGPGLSCVRNEFENVTSYSMSVFISHMEQSGFRRCGRIRYTALLIFNRVCMAIFGRGKLPD